MPRGDTGILHNKSHYMPPSHNCVWVPTTAPEEQRQKIYDRISGGKRVGALEQAIKRDEEKEKRGEMFENLRNYCKGKRRR